MTPEQQQIVRIGVMAADGELLGKPTPVSSVRNPDGSSQSETGHERTRRIVETAVMHLIEQGLLVVPDDIASKLAGPVLLDRLPASLRP